MEELSHERSKIQGDFAMNSFGNMSWRSGLIPMIEPGAMAEILSSVADLGLVVSPKGQILGVLTSPNFEPDLTDWPNALLQSKLTVESVPKLEARLGQFKDENPNASPIELNHNVEGSDVDIPVRYSFHKLSNDENILMLGRDLRPIVDMQQQLVAAQVALEQDYEAQRGHETKFRVLMQAVPDAMVFLSSTTGVIQDCNTAAEKVFGRQREALIGQSIHRGIEETDVLDRILGAAADGNETGTALTFSHSKERYSVSPTLFRSDDENGILCRIAPEGFDGAKADSLQQNLNHFYETGIDAIIFASQDGNFLSANDAFLKLASVAQAQSLKGRSVADYLSRGAVDLKVILENTARTGSIRMYSTKIKGEHGTERSVEISSSALGAGDEMVFALLIRDTNRMETAKTAPSAQNEVDMRSVIELIGSQSLKSIVSRTTDVVEKMCIETAVEMTSNNRVAAAEMLGLSRQSLYVKLRKYGLLER